MLKKIGKADWQELVIGSELPVVIDFGAAWCGPCKKLAPIIAEIASELDGKINFFEVDAGTEPQVAQENAVMSLPTLLMMKDGKEVDRVIGLTSKDKILAKIKSLIG